VASLDIYRVERGDGLYLTTDPEALDIERICAWLDTAYWVSNRSREVIERSLANSVPYGVYTADGAQVAMARATTDMATFAWICDVFVDEAWRAKGVGSWLMRGVIGHLRSLGIPRQVLATRDAHEVYRRVGFSALLVPDRWMEIDERDVG
jgi:GNAT superfamily N-acetyltransferase